MKQGRKIGKSKKEIRVLYVCPWAHRGGHYPQAVVREATALLEVGIDISICTFEGILDQREPRGIRHRTVLSSWLRYPLGILTHSPTLSKAWMIIRLLEAIAALVLAVRLRRSLRYHVLYLRDGNPFIFLPILFGLVLKDCKWVVNLNGAMGQKASFKLFPYRFGISPFW